MSEILSNLLIQLIYFVGNIFLIGYIISLINRFFYRSVGGGMAVCYATGVIGTPIHECSHAIMCVLFGHRITEMRLFQIDNENGVLGYVRHEYNPKNIYHQVGNYFIGVAPIIGGSLFLYFAMMKLVPVTGNEVMVYVGELSALQNTSFSFSMIGDIFSSLIGVIGAIFKGITEGYVWWIFAILAICVSLHMNLSGADIKGALPAIPILAFLLLIPNIILGFLLPGVYSDFLDFMTMAGGYVSGMLIVALVLSAFCLVIALIIRMISALLGRR